MRRKELAGVQKIAGCALVNWTEPEYPQSVLQIYDPRCTSDLNSSEVLATLFDLEMKGVIRQLPGKQFSKVLL